MDCGGPGERARPRFIRVNGQVRFRPADVRTFLTLPRRVEGAEVTHWAWDDIRDLLAQTKPHTHGGERLWLDQLGDYLGTAISSRPAAESLAYCVVVSDDQLGEHTFRDYVTQQRVYFHPAAGGGWRVADRAAKLPGVQRAQRAASAEQGEVLQGGLSLAEVARRCR